MDLDEPARPSRRRVLRAAGGAAAWLPLASALSSCLTLGVEGSPDGPLEVLYLGDATQQESFNQLFDAFQQAHPDIGINARGIAAGDWGTFANTVSTQIAGGKVPDVIQVATEGQRLFAAKGLMEPLDAYMERDRDLVDAYFADVDPRLREWTVTYGSPDGHTYYIPGGYNTTVLYCNTEVFDAAGVELPEREWTWQEFRAAGERIKERTGAFLIPLGFSFPFVDIMPWLLTNGASTLDEDWARGTFASDAAVEAATFVKGLIDDGLAPKPGGTFDAMGQLRNGNLATLGGGRWPTLDVRRLDLLDRVRIVSWPANARPGSPVGWDGWPILKASRKKEKAWTFLTWLMSREASVFYAENGGSTIPARNSVATAEPFLDQAPPGTELLPEAVTYGTPIPSPERGSEVQDVVTQGWQAAITGTKPVRDALEEANDRLGGLL